MFSFVFVFVFVSVFTLSSYLSFHLSLYLFLQLSFYLSLHLSLHLSLWLSLHLCLCLCLCSSLWLSLDRGCVWEKEGEPLMFGLSSVRASCLQSGDRSESSDVIKVVTDVYVREISESNVYITDGYWLCRRIPNPFSLPVLEPQCFCWTLAQSRTGELFDIDTRWRYLYLYLYLVWISIWWTVFDKGCLKYHVSIVCLPKIFHDSRLIVISYKAILWLLWI